MTATSAEFWRWTLSSPLSLWCAAAGALLVICLILCLRAMVRLGRVSRAARRPSGLIADDNGTATVEFALLMPVLLFLILMLAQVTMLMGGNVFVHYAAFAAARTAIVQIPLDTGDSGPNQYSPSSTKHDAILRSAIFAIVPAAGRLESSTGTANLPIDAYVEAVTSFYSTYGETPPVWINKLLRERLNYASSTTTVTVQVPRVVDETQVTFDDLDGEVRPAEPIAVRVDHKLSVGVPYINRLFANGDLGGNTRYTDVYAIATLTNEGIRDEFPPLPPLPRIP